MNFSSELFGEFYPIGLFLITPSVLLPFLSFLSAVLRNATGLPLISQKRNRN